MMPNTTGCNMTETVCKKWGLLTSQGRKGMSKGEESGVGKEYVTKHIDTSFLVKAQNIKLHICQ